MDDEMQWTLADVRFGLGVVDFSPQPRYAAGQNVQGSMDVLHAVFYINEPTQNDKDSLLREVIEDESFGISDKSETLAVVDLPDYMVKAMLKDVEEGVVEVERHDNHDAEGEVQ